MTAQDEARLQRSARKRIRKLLLQAKPCPRCGNAPPEVDLGFLDYPFAEGEEFFSCPVVFNIGMETHSCGSHAQGLAAWNWQPAADAMREIIKRFEPPKVTT